MLVYIHLYINVVIVFNLRMIDITKSDGDLQTFAFDYKEDCPCYVSDYMWDSIWVLSMFCVIIMLCVQIMTYSTHTHNNNYGICCALAINFFFIMCAYILSIIPTSEANKYTDFGSKGVAVPIRYLKHVLFLFTGGLCFFSPSAWSALWGWSARASGRPAGPGVVTIAFQWSESEELGESGPMVLLRLSLS